LKSERPSQIENLLEEIKKNIDAGNFRFSGMQLYGEKKGQFLHKMLSMS
jgi:hypothetical protein